MTVQVLAEKDLWVAGASALVAAAALALALSPGRSGEGVPTTPIAASVKHATGGVKVRLALTLGWTGASRGVEVHEETLRAPEGRLPLTFTDSTELALDERSLVVIERSRSGVGSVTLRQGSVWGRVGSGGLTLQTPAGEARLEAMTEARVEIEGEQLEVSVKQGAANLKNRKGELKIVSSGQRVAAASSGTKELAPFAFQLLTPLALARLPFQKEPGAVTLTWAGHAPGASRVQVARDRLFAFVDAEFSAEGGSLVLTKPSKGVTWWRIVDGTGRSVSEARRFTCIEDVAPVGMYPRSGEVLLAPLGALVGFAWAPLPGISRYQLEISSSQGFEPLTVSQVAGQHCQGPLSERGHVVGVVRADDETGLGVPSPPIRFRVITRIPEAPELLNPEIEVTP